MKNLTTIIAEINFIRTLSVITESYQDISVTRMQRIRGSVLKTRDYLKSFSELFHDIKLSYKNELVKLMKKNKIKNLSNLSMVKKNGKTVSILISANTKLHGDIVQKVMYLFVESIQKDNSSDIMIIGKLGRAFFEQLNIKRPYWYFEIPDIDLTLDNIKPIIYNIYNYEKINVFYGKFENIMTQVPTVSNVTGHEPFDAINNTSQPSPEERFLFEPSLQNIMEFFETQIFASLFKQTIYESQLARLASRLKSMEEAHQNILLRGHNLYNDKRKAKQLLMNKKQLEMLSGISIWNKR